MRISVPDVKNAVWKKVCPVKAARVVDGVLEIDMEKCTNCGRCIGACHFDAIESGKCGYKVYIGGRWGKQVAQGRALDRILRRKKKSYVRWRRRFFYTENRARPANALHRRSTVLVLKKVQEEILSDDILGRKQEILDARLHEVRRRHLLTIKFHKTGLDLRYNILYNTDNLHIRKDLKWTT